ncbi:autotransporter assembly complex protein TamA [Roseibium hamelinense]|uniref:autotransporter assembly complex protein TamA n=1 Tax=Roseibium hamelinense TaxID=150831 RepID=UPI001AD92799|nr:autotransporter assembly complex family protein [Roseibium hamelinense]
MRRPSRAPLSEKGATVVLATGKHIASPAREVYAQKPCSKLLKAVAFGLLVSTCLTPLPASAFELFGVRLWGSDAEETQTVPNPLPYKAELSLSSEKEDLQSRLESASLLVSEESKQPSGTDGLIARALSDRERIVASLYGAGYYGGTLTIRLGDETLEQALETGNVSSARPLPVQILVDPGPLFRFGNIEISAADAAASDTGLSENPAEWGLTPGEPALSGEILSAERAILRKLRDHGFPKARISERVIVADHKTDLLDVRLSAIAGPKARFGAVSVSGTEVTDPDFVARQAIIPVGATYSPEELEAARKRLDELGIFSSIRLVEGDIGPDGVMPITIEVTERKRHVIGAGASWSSTEGFGLEAYWRRRNLFGRGELLSIEGSVGQIGSNSVDEMEYSTRIAFEKPGAFGPLTTFTTSLGAKQEAPDAYTSRNVTLDAYLSKKYSDRLTGRVGAELFYANEEDVFGNSDYLLVGTPADAVYDSRDDKLNPSKGIYAAVFGEPAYDTLGQNAMVFLKGTFSTYVALDEAKRFILAGRVSAGSILGPDIQDIPASRRFIAGGGGSIRGYAYRNVGPRVDGEVAGGRSLLELSGEVRVKITDTIGVVGFVDAGNAYEDSFPDFADGLKIGVGAGVRYFTPIGPLRIDAGVPLDPEKDDPDFAIYVGLSQAF